MTIFVLLVYLVLLTIVSRRVTRHRNGNEAFFVGNRTSSWPMVAFGMIGASVSAVSLVSVPGMVLHHDMTYLQMCLGFIPGYVIVALVLLPLYYRLRLTTIYSLLGNRLGYAYQRSASLLFLVSKFCCATVRFFAACMILHHAVLQPFGLPMWLTVMALVGAVWMYSHVGGIRSLVYTDVIHTSVMLVSLVFLFVTVMDKLDFSLSNAVVAVANHDNSTIFDFTSVLSADNFWKQFLSGMLIVVVMTGLDQDMMQKNLTCRTLNESQKNMLWCGVSFVPFNLLLLSIGILVMMYSGRECLPLPEIPDRLLSDFAFSHCPNFVSTVFILGVVAASLSTADSSLTAITTCLCVDIIKRQHSERLRKAVHIAVNVVFALAVMAFGNIHDDSLLNVIYTLVSILYGPLLGMFAFAIFSKRKPDARFAIPCSLLPPLCSLLISHQAAECLNYKFGYELLLLNALITCALLLVARRWPVFNPKTA